MRRAHVVGAGLAGLSAAMALIEKGYSVRLSEAAPHAGGRCRSYRDPKLGVVIDNGNHLVLSGNTHVGAYLERIGASGGLIGPEEAIFDFADLRDGARWRLRPNAGPIPWWIASSARRVPGTKARDYLPLAKLGRAGRDETIPDSLPAKGLLWERLLDPFFVSALNTPSATASAKLAGAIVTGTLQKGGRACRPLVAHPTLGATFVDPALAWLKAKGADIRLGRRLRAIDAGDRVIGLTFADTSDPIAADEPVILAVPAWSATELLPGLTAPDQHHAIVNAHFLMPAPANAPLLTGVIGGTAHWIFAFPDRLSVTISAADALCDMDRDQLAARIWADVAATLSIPEPMPPWQIVRERRATFAATPAQDRRRPAARTSLANLFLAGDWTQTGLPATIEGAIQSGETAAALTDGR
ncbi:squalene-associated FAD-dependent desaturase [Sphingomonas vulcanisoli]|uniref:Squalene-associated FAD-dependent desaturase n=1 Tax=Sphingomonas vulcanisoli TaxID=1658060 RepID=A0ABX0TQQ9_9SPHN|nr:squalene-associated FAD-dependent desaturase [Sphingomonas vulcanisoli]